MTRVSQFQDTCHHTKALTSAWYKKHGDSVFRYDYSTIIASWRTFGYLYGPCHDLLHVHLLALLTGEVLIQRPSTGKLCENTHIVITG